MSVKGLSDIAIGVHTSELRDVTCHGITDKHTVLPTIPTQANAPRLTPTRKAGVGPTRLTDPGGVGG